MVRAATAAGLAALCVLLLGCGGVHRDLVYRPLAPASPQGGNPIGREIRSYWQLDLGDAELRVGGVVLSSKLLWLVGPAIAAPTVWEKEQIREGPLRIFLLVKAKGGASVTFDPEEFTVIMGDGSTLSPIGVAESVAGGEVEPIESVTVSGEDAWHGALEYDVPLQNLEPFTFHLGTLRVDGRPVSLPELSFTRDESYYSS